MSRRFLVAMGVVAGLINPALGLPAQAAGSAPDLTGYWRLDAAHSDSPQRMGGGGAGGQEGGQSGESGGGRRGGWGGGGGGGMRRGGGGGGGGWGGGGGGMGGGGRGSRGGEGRGDAAGGGGAPQGARPVRLPDLMHVTETESVVSFEDSTGTVLQEITTLGAVKDTLTHSPGAAVVAGSWKDASLTVERQSPRGKITQTYTLQDSGATLVVVTRMESSDSSMPAREFKRVYKKATDS
jgi:hypothetical protein